VTTATAALARARGLVVVISDFRDQEEWTRPLGALRARHSVLAIEVRDPREIDEALAAGAPRLLLDNMSPHEIAAAAVQVAGRAELEASGGVTPETVVVYSTINGLDYVSMGALTHSAPALDLSLLLELPT